MKQQARRLGIVLLVFASAVAWAQTPRFAVNLPNRTMVKAAGEYRAEGVVMNLETFSALCLEPSTTATFQILGPETRSITKAANRNHLVVHEEKPALKENPGKEPFFTRAEGAISAFTWIDSKFTNPMLSAEVNTDGGPGGAGSFSRQGLMARWDQGNNFYWFYIDFAGGTYAIMRSRFFGVMENLADARGRSSWNLPGFKNTNSYFLEFELQGGTMKGRIYAQTANGQKGQIVAQTPSLKDKDPFPSGLSGYLAEASLGKPFAPLHGSFGELSSVER